MSSLTSLRQITDYINFHVFESTTDQIRLLEMAGWEQGLWFVCTFLNLAAFGFWVVYMFEIIQQEVDAIKAQQEVGGGQLKGQQGLAQKEP